MLLPTETERRLRQQRGSGPPLVFVLGWGLTEGLGNPLTCWRERAAIG